MLPRVDVVALSTTKSKAENLEIIRTTGHSRYPYCDPDLDHVKGVVHTRDIVRKVIANSAELELDEILRPANTVPDTQPLARLILDMQSEQTHTALVVDEHGTAVGMVFLEDALEEIVGPIHDEFDNRAPWIDKKGDTFEMAGGVPLPDAAHLLQLDLGTEEDTIGGYIISQLKRLPVAGDEVEVPPYRAQVVAMSRRRVARVRFTRGDTEQPPTTAPGSEPAGTGTAAPHPEDKS
jgi:CBS domain containing-hemolysin-like protein